MLDDLKELEKFFKICRKQGVTEIKMQGISVKFGDLPMKNSEASSSETEDVLTETLTPDELLYYAVQEQGQA